jgi:excisionase family DNA binding protein
VPRPRRASGDLELVLLFDRFQGRLVTPAGAAALLGVSRQTIHTLCDRGQMRALRGGQASATHWTYLPLEDVHAYAVRTQRSTPEMDRWDRWL